MPEMDVTRSGAVANSGTDALGAVGGTAVVLSYTITNNGNAALSLTLPVTIGALTNCTCAGDHGAHGVCGGGWFDDIGHHHYADRGGLVSARHHHQR